VGQKYFLEDLLKRFSGGGDWFAKGLGSGVVFECRPYADNLNDWVMRSVVLKMWRLTRDLKGEQGEGDITTSPQILEHGAEMQTRLGDTEIVARGT